jgi:ADP-heptose:LPS heptosyltransferase
MHFSLIKRLSTIFIRYFYLLIKNNPRKIKTVFVFRHDELGDWTLWLSAAAELRKFYSSDEYHIVLVGKPGMELLNQQCPYWDEVISFDIKSYLSSFWYRIRTIFKLLRADIVLNPVLNRNITIDQLVGYTCAGERIGIDVKADQVVYRPEAERSYGNSFYTRLISLDLNTNMLEINAEFVRAVIGEDYEVVFDSLEFISEINPEIDDYILIVPGAGSPKRCWEPEKFAAIINLITKEKPDLKIVLSGTAKELECSGNILNNVDKAGDVLNLCGKTDLLELCGLIKGAGFVLSNDTAATHLAASYKVPSICILGGGHFGMFHPYNSQTAAEVNSVAVYSPMNCYNCNWHCYKSPYSSVPYPCISAVPAEAVWPETKKLLERA